MLFEWDEAKAQSDLRKHGIDFETASRVFLDPLASAELDRIEGGEDRWRTIGAVGITRIVVVAHSYGGDEGEETVRIVSARPATPRERRTFGKNS